MRIVLEVRQSGSPRVRLLEHRGRLSPSGLVLSLVLLLAGLSKPVMAQQGPDDRENPRPPDASTGRTNEENVEATLELISNLQMHFGPVDFVTTSERGQPFSDVVNPFKARKRGSFFGSVYEYHRNDNLDARNFFDPVGEPLPEFKRNQFGFTMGARFSDRFSVFGTYDGLRIVRGSTLVSLIPTPHMKRGDFSALETQLRNPFTGELFPNNQIPGSLIHPVTRNLLSLIPDPNRDDPTRNYVNNAPVVQNEDNYSGRVDYETNSGMKIFGQYTLVESNRVNVRDLPSFGTTEERRRQDFSVSANRSFGATFTSNLRLILRRNESSQLSKNVDQQGLLESLGIEGLVKQDELDEGYPEFNLSGYVNLGLDRRSQSPRTSVDNTFQLEGSATYSPNDHKFSFGAEVEHNQYNNNRSNGLSRGRFEFSGTYTGDSFADFLLGIPDSASHSLGSDRADLRRTRYKFFFRDDWRVNSKLNFSFSLAYNYYAPYRSVRNNISTFVPLEFDPPLSGQLVQVGSEEALAAGLDLKPGFGYFPDRNDWEPRIGIAVSPLGNNQLVIRASYQLSYDPLDSRNGLEYLGRNFPFFYIEEADAPSDSPDIDLSRPFTAAAPAAITIQTFDPYVRTAYIQEWQLTLQNQFARNWTIDATYQGRKATGLDNSFPANVPFPGPGAIQERRPNPDFGLFRILSNRASSIGHQLQVELEKRFSKGYSVQAGFTWNRTFSDQFFLDPADPRNLRLERALNSFGSPLQSYVNYIFDLPFGPDRRFSTSWAGKLKWLLEGWRLSGRTNIQGGRLFSIRLSGDSNNDGLTGDRPDRIASGLLPKGERSIDRWFDTTAFVNPAPYAIGNAQRNILFGPGLNSWDISLIKQTRLNKSGSALEFRVQFFNAFNHTNFNQPSSTFGSENFGQILRAEESREIEIAIKYSF